MKCPYCGSADSKVVDSRPVDDGSAIRRRRECEKCGRRITTYEEIEHPPIFVIKKNFTRELFDRDKVMRGIVRACQKRPVGVEDMERIVRGLEAKLAGSQEREVTTTFIGEEIMDALRKLDDVAYVRFASVYREFKDIQSFYEELAGLSNKGLGKEEKK